MKTATVALLSIVLGLCFFEAFGKLVDYELKQGTFDWCTAYEKCNNGKLLDVGLPSGTWTFDASFKKFMTNPKKSHPTSATGYFWVTAANNGDHKDAAKACKLGDEDKLAELANNLACAIRHDNDKFLTITTGGACTNSDILCEKKF